MIADAACISLEEETDWRAFLDISLSTAKCDRTEAKTSRSLSLAIESLCMLNAQQRRGFLVAVKDKLTLLDSSD